MPNLILGIIENYTKDQIAPFINSLKMSGYKGEVVLFVNNIPNDLKKFLMETDLNIKLIFYNRIKIGNIGFIRFLCAVFFRVCGTIYHERILKSSINVCKILWNCAESRFFFFYDFLLQSKIRYENVLICDTRDTVFQLNPFPDKMEPGVYLFEEFSAIKISQQWINARWIRLIFGRSVLTEFGNKPIICSGIIMGAYDDMMFFLEKMIPLLPAHGWHWGTDQAIVNYLVYKNILVNARIVPFGTGPAIHLGIVPRNAINVSKDGKILCGDGSPYSIIHQFDRHDDIKEKILLRYG